MPDKFLTEDGWKPLVSKFKLKDKELQKALFMYEEQLDDDFEYQLKYLGRIATLAANLKKDKEVSGNAEVVKYLTSILGAIEVEKRDIAKAKAVAAKAPKKDEAAGKAKEEEEEEDGDFQVKLAAAFQKLKGSKDVVYEFIICEAKPFCGVMIAKKITPKHREELSKVTGSKRFLSPGTCSFTQGKFNFATEKPAPGLAKKLQGSIKNYTGKKLPIAVGTETANDDDEQPAGAAAPTGAASPSSGSPAGAAQPGQPEGSGHNSPTPGAAPAAADAPAIGKGPLALTGSVGRGGKNKLEEVQAVQTALNNRAKAGLPVDGKCGTKTIAAIMAFQKTLGFMHTDGLIEPGKKTEQGLNGAAVKLSEAEKSHPGAGGGATAAGGEAAAASGKEAAHPGEVGGAFAAEAKAGKEIAERDKKTLQACSGWVKRITDMLGRVTDAGAVAEGTKLRELLKKTVIENHNGPVSMVKEALARLTTQPETETAEEVKQAVEKATKGFKVLDDLTDDAMTWTTMNSHPTAAAGEPRTPGAERKAA